MCCTKDEPTLSKDKVSNQQLNKKLTIRFELCFPYMIEVFNSTRFNVEKLAILTISATYYPQKTQSVKLYFQ
ncbi:MAG: hypothetical protein CL811_11315 [Colwelliaceae bacterium]|nr:hypothetical protein [Colwelliaceae bacterium]